MRSESEARVTAISRAVIYFYFKVFREDLLIYSETFQREGTSHPLSFSVWGEGCGEQLPSDANTGKLKRNVDCFYCNRRSEQTEKPTPSDPKQAGGELKAGFRRQQAPPLPSEGESGRGELAAPGLSHGPQQGLCARGRLGGRLPSGKRVFHREHRRLEGGEAPGRSQRLWENLPGSSWGTPATFTWAGASGPVRNPAKSRPAGQCAATPCTSPLRPGWG